MNEYEAEQMAKAEKLVEERLDEAAETYRTRQEEMWRHSLPGNHSPAQAVLLAYLMTAHDGYNSFTYEGTGGDDAWKRSREGWITSLFYLEEPAPSLLFDFVVEARFNEFTRVLAIDIEGNDAGVRSPAKRAREARVAAHGFAHMLISEAEIMADPANCLERVESVVSNMVEDVLMDAGKMPRREPRPAPEF